jgi:hypothetical protein
MKSWRALNFFKSWRANHKGRIMVINLKLKQRLIYRKFCKINNRTRIKQKLLIKLMLNQRLPKIR